MDATVILTESTHNGIGRICSYQIVLIAPNVRRRGGQQLGGTHGYLRQAIEYQQDEMMNQLTVWLVASWICTPMNLTNECSATNNC